MLHYDAGMKPTSKASTLTNIADTLRASGGRATSARTRVLTLLQAATFPLSHAEIDAILDSEPQARVDRVTLYRVLDWLAENGLAHKAADAHGVFRYKASTPDVNHAGHIHFRCTECNGIYCLKAPVPRTPALPTGFHLTRINLDLQGECARCSSSHR